MGAKPLIAIACGGTGGHLFPGIAVGEVLRARNCAVTLLVSQKEVDQHATQTSPGANFLALPAVGMQGGNWAAFLRGFAQSFFAARELFRAHRPQAVLGMGGFTSAPPILAGKICGAATFLHESNSVPGRANRLLASFVDEVFVGFPSARTRLHNHHALSTGTPVRSHFQPASSESCRTALGLLRNQPVLLIVGGSQGATALNTLMLEALPSLRESAPDLQFLHLTGAADLEKVRAAYSTAGANAVVRPFLTEVDLALGAATVAVSRAGASSLAELAAMRVPSILIPYPHAANNHQYYNARAYADAGAAWLLVQSEGSQGRLTGQILELLRDANRRRAMADELARWHAPHAAEKIADHILALIKAQGFSSQEDSKTARDTESHQLNSAIA